MPTIYGMRLPEPSDWQEFELITRDAMQLKWTSPMLQRNGRAGQEQQGVDIYGPDQLGRPVAIQCKNSVKQLSLKKVKAEIENAEAYKGKLLTIYIATSPDIYLLNLGSLKLEVLRITPGGSLSLSERTLQLGPLSAISGRWSSCSKAAI